ncbi:MAG: 50S ribosomal protein L30 [Myxococcales bacterium]
MTKRLKVTQQKSSIGRPESQRKSLLALGLRKIRDSREVEDTPSNRGLIKKIGHLITVEE